MVDKFSQLILMTRQMALATLKNKKSMFMREFPQWCPMYRLGQGAKAVSHLLVVPSERRLVV